MARVTNEKKNLNRLAGEFLVASRLTQRGYMVTLQWGTTIGYDILVFDKAGNVAFLEVKSSAQYSRRWILQNKYASPESDAIPLARRFVCCVNLANGALAPDVFVFPAEVVANGLHYYIQQQVPEQQQLSPVPRLQAAGAYQRVRRSNRWGVYWCKRLHRQLRLVGHQAGGGMNVCALTLRCRGRCAIKRVATQNPMPKKLNCEVL